MIAVEVVDVRLFGSMWTPSLATTAYTISSPLPSPHLHHITNSSQRHTVFSPQKVFLRLQRLRNVDCSRTCSRLFICHTRIIISRTLSLLSLSISPAFLIPRAFSKSPTRRSNRTSAFFLPTSTKKRVSKKNLENGLLGSPLSQYLPFSVVCSSGDRAAALGRESRHLYCNIFSLSLCVVLALWERGNVEHGRLRGKMVGSAVWYIDLGFLWFKKKRKRKGGYRGGFSDFIIRVLSLFFYIVREMCCVYVYSRGGFFVIGKY